MTPKLTFRGVQLQLLELGVTLRRTPFAPEMRVGLAGGSEEQAYYTESLEDALETGREMARRRQRQYLQQKGEPL